MVMKYLIIKIFLVIGINILSQSVFSDENELIFINVKPLYKVGDIVEIKLRRLKIREYSSMVDLWVIIRMPNNILLFKSEMGINEFSLNPQPFKKKVSTFNDLHSIVNFKVIPGFGGDYTFFAVYVEVGKNPMVDPITSYYSGISRATITLRNRSNHSLFELGDPFRDELRDYDDLGPEMIWISPNTFTIGNIRGEGKKDEQPKKGLFIGAFAIGKYEVTFAEYDRFIKSVNGERLDDEGWGRNDRPVINVSWFDAIAYTQWLSQQTGYQYRLPTEAEWEYVAKGGTETRYWWGEQIGFNQVNCASSCNDDFSNTAPVGSFRSNPFGVYDILGNVREWTCSKYEFAYNGEERICATTDTVIFVTVRGGAYNSGSEWIRSTYRLKRRPETMMKNTGFRVVRE